MIELSKETLANLQHFQIEDVQLKMSENILQLFPDNFQTSHEAQTFVDEVYKNMQNFPSLRQEDYPAVCLMAATIDQSDFYNNTTMKLCIDQVNDQESFTDIFNKASVVLSALVKK